MIRAVFLVAILLVSSIARPASAEHAGLVFVDLDADGVRDPGEPVRSGVVVSNGRAVVVSGADGHYALPDQGAGFVVVSCPADARCPVWFHRGEGGADFGLVPRPVEGDFFFVQISDVHAYPRVEDFAVLMHEALPSWLPRPVAGWLLLRWIGRMYPTQSREELVSALRDVVSRSRDVSEAWDSEIMMDYLDLATDPATGIIVPGREIPRALAEVAALSPRFVVSTGDMILEGNDGDPEPVESWFRYYQGLVADAGLDVYETIGNNELAGTDNDDFPMTDPRYGKELFRRYFGPTHYSFDRGPFHFVALDTHRPEAEPGERGDWSFSEMEPEVRDWLEADLAAASSRGLRIVVLNHEPFHNDPVWDYDDYEPADDEGLFAKYGVAYALAGHMHRNGYEDAPPGGGVTHITTGALSGFRWVLPPGFDSRGYRLFYARDGLLYSAWKPTGEPLLGFVDPRGAGSIHPASTHASQPDALAGRVDVVAVAADVSGPFASVELRLGDEPLESERWGDYFLHAAFDASRIPAQGGALVLHAKGRDGSLHRVRLVVARQPAG